VHASRSLRHLVEPARVVETVGWALAAAAWLVLVVGVVLGWSSAVDHHHLLGGHVDVGPRDLVTFFAAWQLMVVAMMLPSALPTVGLFVRAGAAQPRRGLALTTFLGSYIVVWTAFAVVALAGDALLHELAHRLPVLLERQSLVSGVVVAFAGAFQFTALKHRCLEACRNPVQFLFRFYRRGVRGALHLGMRHAAFCLGCCWALMLVMFAVGVHSLAWMLALTGVMVLEKSSPIGARIVPYVGVAMVVYGGATMLRGVFLS
jgi:predicted metal-binding membrane protein